MNNSYKLYITFLLFIVFNTNIIFAMPIKTENSNKENLNPNTMKELLNAKEGLLNETKTALISETTLKTQNYTNPNTNFNFSKFKKVTLKTVILETLSASNTLKAAKEKLIQAKLALKESNSGYLPTVDFELSSKIDKRYGVIYTQDDKRGSKLIHDQRYKFKINQPLYSGGTTAIKIKSDEFKYKQAKYKYEIVLNQTIQKAIDAYFKLLFNIEKIEITTNNMHRLEKILNISQAKFDSGAISTGDLAAIKAGVANAQTDLNDISSKLSNSIDYYLYLLNNRFQNTKPYQKNFSINLSTYEELKDEIIEKNLVLINYRLNILETKYKLKSFKYNLKPKIDLQLEMSHILNQEDYIDDQQDYSAKLIFRYNLYNKGKDVNKIVKTYSSIEELQYRYKEEIKKISWDTSKLYNSIKALSKSLKSVKDEIKSSKEMTDVYWEGFQLGEQDLQVLLQGEKQLNSAQLNLLKFKQDYLTNMFKVLNQSNKLASFFDIDPYSRYFIDYTNVEQINTKIDMNNTLISNNLDLNDTIDSYLEVINEYSFNDIVNFKDKFLEAKNEDYTVVISSFKNTYDAYNYIKTNRMYVDSFAYDYFDDNGTLSKITLDKRIKTKTNIAHGIYINKEDAKTSINNLFNNENKKFSIVKIKDIKKLYSNYINGLKLNIKPYIIKPIPKKRFQTDPLFKERFLNANKDNFTINVVSLSSMKQAQSLLENEKITKESFVFKYGRNGEWIKVMYGIYPTYSQALEGLNNKEKLIKNYHPIIEKISNKQDLYNKYINFNKKIKVKTKFELANKQDIKTQIKQIKKDKKLKVKRKDPKPKKEILPKNKIVKEKQNKLVHLVKKDLKPKVNNKKVRDPKPKKEILLEVNKKIKKQKTKLLELVKKDPKPKVNSNKVKDPKPKKEILLEVNKKTKKQKNKLNKLNDKVKKHKIKLNKIKKPKKEILKKDDNKTKRILPFKMTKKNVKTIRFTKPKKFRNNFEKLFFNAKKGSYSIILGTVKKQKIKYFINRYILDDKYIISKYKSKYRIIYGIYDNKTVANRNIKNLHPKIIRNAKIIKIESVK